MVVSVQIADVGLSGPLIRAPKPADTPGLLHADVGLCAALGDRPPRPSLGRVALVSFWSGDEGLDGFLTEHPLAQRMAPGWSARLEPLRAYGQWPGLADDVSRKRAVVTDGPVVVLTLGRVRLPRTIPFLRTSARAESRVIKSPGLLWATGAARPPFVATISIWESARSAADYAYGSDNDDSDNGTEHTDAINRDRSRPFHHRNAFIRCRPLEASGTLDGRNPLPELQLT